MTHRAGVEAAEFIQSRSWSATVEWKRRNLDTGRLTIKRRGLVAHGRRINGDDNGKRSSRGTAQPRSGTRTIRFARPAVEIVVHLNNEPATVSRAMVSAATPNAEILASCFHWGPDGASVRLVTEDAEKTEQALTRAGFQYQTGSVLLIGLGEKPGVAAATVLLLAQAGIGLSYSYVSCTDDHEAIAVFKTTDDDQAARVLQVEALVESVALAKTWQGSSRRAAQSAQVAHALAATFK